jgi:ribonuclease HI
MLGALELVGWEMLNPTQLVDHNGQVLNLLDGSPAKLRRLLHEAIDEQNQEAYMYKVVCKGLGTDDEFKGYRKYGVSFRAIQKALKSKELSPGEKRAVGKAFSGGTLTAAKFSRLGFEVEDKCPLCGLEADSVRHRAWECSCRPHLNPTDASEPDDVKKEVPEAEQRRRAEVRREAKKAGPESWLYERGLGTKVVHPMANMGSRSITYTNGWEMFRPEGGPIYTDGSCIDPSGSMPRAGYAAVQINDQGDIIRGLWSSVPSPWPQEANTAEHIALFHAFEHAQPGCRILSDCMTVVKGWINGIAWASGPKRPHGGIWRELAASIQKGNGVTSVEKTKAHRDLAQLEGDELRHGRGNAAADSKAGVGAALHDISPGDRKWVAAQESMELDAVMEMARALGAWPSSFDLFGDLKKKEKVPTEKIVRAKRTHRMGWINHVWRCIDCHSRPRNGRAAPEKECPGCDESTCKIIINPQGHKLVQAWEGDVEASRSIVWCTRCGCHTHYCPRGLRNPCRKVERGSGGQALKKLRQGLHPSSGLTLSLHMDLSGFASAG